MKGAGSFFQKLSSSINQKFHFKIFTGQISGPVLIFLFCWYCTGIMFSSDFFTDIPAQATFKYLTFCIFFMSQLPVFFLLHFWQCGYLLAIYRATSIVMFFAFIALDEQQVTIVVGAVGMFIAGFSALVATADHLAVYCFSQPVIENKILTNKFRRQLFFGYQPGIFDDTSVQLVYIFKSPVFQVSAGFLAPDAAGTIQ
jgi:hypothetical protein